MDESVPVKYQLKIRETATRSKNGLASTLAEVDL